VRAGSQPYGWNGVWPYTFCCFGNLPVLQGSGGAIHSSLLKEASLSSVSDVLMEWRVTLYMQYGACETVYSRMLRYTVWISIAHLILYIYIYVRTIHTVRSVWDYVFWNAVIYCTDFHCTLDSIHVYVCVCIYTYTYIVHTHAHTRIHMYTNTYVHICIYMYICVNKCICVCIHIYGGKGGGTQKEFVYVCVCVCDGERKRDHAEAQTSESESARLQEATKYVYKHVCIDIYIHISIYMWNLWYM